MEKAGFVLGLALIALLGGLVFALYRFARFVQGKVNNLNTQRLNRFSARR